MLLWPLLLLLWPLLLLNPYCCWTVTVLVSLLLPYPYCCCPPPPTQLLLWCLLLLFHHHSVTPAGEPLLLLWPYSCWTSIAIVTLLCCPPPPPPPPPPIAIVTPSAVIPLPQCHSFCCASAPIVPLQLLNLYCYCNSTVLFPLFLTLESNMLISVLQMGMGSR